MPETAVDTEASTLLTFLVAGALGGLVGLQRQLSHADDPTGGLRTFALYGVWGAAAALFGERYGGVAFAAAMITFTTLLIAAYIGEGRRRGDWGTSTEAAALVVFLCGALTWIGEATLAAALAVAATALLQAKTAIHELNRRFSDQDVRTALQFGVVTAVILPVVPETSLGPGGALDLHQVWLMVVLVSGIGFVGYLALRAQGSRGLALTGVLGGLVSSTAVTLGFSRMSRDRTIPRNALAAGLVGASALMFPRVAVEAVAVSPSLARRLVLPLVAIGAGALVVAALWWWRDRAPTGEHSELVALENPLRLRTALQFGVLFGVIVVVASFLREQVSSSSLYVVGVASGVTDVDAITLSTATLVRDGLDVTVGARTVLLAVATNTAVKAGMIAALATPDLRRRVLRVMVPAAGLSALALVFV